MITKQQQYNEIIEGTIHFIKNYRDFGLPKVDPLTDFLLENGIKVFSNDNSFAHEDKVVFINYDEYHPSFSITRVEIDKQGGASRPFYLNGEDINTKSFVSINKSSIIIAFADNDFEKNRDNRFDRWIHILPLYPVKRKLSET